MLAIFEMQEYETYRIAFELPRPAVPSRIYPVKRVNIESQVKTDSHIPFRCVMSDAGERDQKVITTREGQTHPSFIKHTVTDHVHTSRDACAYRSSKEDEAGDVEGRAEGATMCGAAWQMGDHGGGRQDEEAKRRVARSLKSRKAGGGAEGGGLMSCAPDAVLSSARRAQGSLGHMPVVYAWNMRPTKHMPLVYVWKI